MNTEVNVGFRVLQLRCLIRYLNEHFLDLNHLWILVSHENFRILPVNCKVKTLHFQ